MKRILSLVLALAISLSSISVTGYAAEKDSGSHISTSTASKSTGSLEVKVGFIYTETAETITKKNVSLGLQYQGNTLGSILLNKDSITSASDTLTAQGEQYPYTIRTLNAQGEEMVNQTAFSYLTVEFSNLPIGSYQVKLEGAGFKSYLSDSIPLEKYNQSLVVLTSDNGFTIGDINGDNRVDKNDLRLLEQHLGAQSGYQESADLNRDGVLDIVDIALINHHIYALAPEREVFDTTAIVSAIVDSTGLADQNDKIQVEGSLADIFVPDTEPVKLKQDDVISEQAPLSVHIPLTTPLEMQQMEIDTPADIDIQAGTVTVLYEEDGVEKTMDIRMDATSAAGVHAITRDAGRNTVVINLGKKVAVKKVTIHVEKVMDANGDTTYVTIEEVKFIKDIVPANPKPDNGIVKGLKAVAGSNQVTLHWNTTPNVTGYKVFASTVNSNNLKDFTEVETTGKNTAVVSGINGKKLENLKTYYFTVVSINEDWQSGMSGVVSAMPMPNGKPLPPDNVSVSGEDRSLMVRWGKAEDATRYHVYYRMADVGSFTKATTEAVTATTYSIGGLTNGQEYEVYVTALNDIGESGPSLTHSATPVRIEYKDPGVPRKNMIDPKTITHHKTSNVNNSFYPNGFSMGNVLDGDFATHWTAGAWWWDHTLTFTFDEPHTMDFLTYVTRLDGNYYRSIGHYSITVWGPNDDLNGPGQKIVTDRSPQYKVKQGEERGYYIMPFPKSEVKQIAVNGGMWNGAPTVPSVSEIFFYDYYSLVDDVSALFSDSTYTQLKPGVTKEDILALRTELNDGTGYYLDAAILNGELDLAESLLSGSQEKLGKQIHGIYSTGGFQPLGVSGLGGKDVVIYAQIPEGETVTVTPTQYYAEASSWKGTPTTLVNGRNVITIPTLNTVKKQHGGPLYLNYTGSRGSEIKLHVKNYDPVTNLKNASMREIPVLELYNWESMTQQERRDEIARYIKELKAYLPTISANGEDVRNTTEVSMPNMLLSIPASTALQGVQAAGSDLETQVTALYNNTLAWSELMGIVYTTNGVDEDQIPSVTRENIRYMRMFGKAFMYAAGSHIGVGYGSTQSLMMGRPTSLTGPEQGNQLFGWGIAHEIGHNKDTIGYAEVTNNIYSLFGQSWDGKNNANTTRVPFADVYRKVSRGALGRSNNVFVQLGMYWQLHLGYDGVYKTQQDNFFYNFNKIWKTDEHKSLSKDDRIAVVASQVAKKDLTEYFTRWGMELSEEAKTAMREFPEETRALYYLDDAARLYRITGRQDLDAVSITAQTKQDEQDNVILSWNALSDQEQEALQGFEILKNDKSIAFVTADQNSYTDEVGAANNLSYRYSLVPITKLGTRLSAVDAGQVKLSHDAVIDRSLWSHQVEEDGTILFTMGETQSISGIRVTGDPAALEGMELTVEAILAGEEVTPPPVSPAPSTPETTPGDENNSASSSTPETTPGDENNSAGSSTPETTPGDENNSAGSSTPETTPGDENNSAGSSTPETTPGDENNGASSSTPETTPGDENSSASSSTPETTPGDENNSASSSTPETALDDGAENADGTASVMALYMDTEEADALFTETLAENTEPDSPAAEVLPGEGAGESGNPAEVPGEGTEDSGNLTPAPAPGEGTGEPSNPTPAPAPGEGVGESGNPAEVPGEGTEDSGNLTPAPAPGEGAGESGNPAEVPGEGTGEPSNPTPAPAPGEGDKKPETNPSTGFVPVKTLDFTKNDSADANKFITYFNKPKAPVEDTRIWTYDVSQVRITGFADKAQAEEFVSKLDFIQYPGDNIELNYNAIGLLKENYVYDESQGEDGMIKAGTLIMTGTYRGDPVYNKVFMKGKYQERSQENVDEVQIIERDIAGYSLLFAEIPEDGEVSTISDGFWIFVPDIQKEAELQDKAGHDCVQSLLPSEIRAELLRGDTPDSAGGRVTSNTIWVLTPSYDSMSDIVLQ